MALRGIVIGLIVYSCTKESTGERVIFQDVGRLYNAHTITHVTIQLDLTDFIKHAEYMDKTVERWASRGNTTLPSIQQMWKTGTARPHSLATQRLWQTLKATTSEALTRARYLLPQVQGRDKRQVLVAAAAITGTVLGLYDIYGLGRLQAKLEHLEGVIHHDQPQLQRLQGEAKRQRQAIEYLATAVSQASHDQELVVALQEALVHATAFAQTIQGVSQGIHELVAHQRMSPLLLQPAEAEAILRTLPRSHHKDQVVGLHELYQMPASFIADSKRVLAILHIPTAAQELRLLRYLPLPVPLHDGEQERTIAIRPTASLLALGEGGRHREIAPSELAECVHLGRTYTCPDEGFRTRMGDSCLGALYREDITAVLRRCPWSPHDGSWEMAPLSDRQVAVYSKATTRITIACPNGTRTSIAVTGFRLISVEAGCEASNDRFVFRGRVDVARARQVSYAPKWKLAELTGEDQQWIRGIRERLRSDVDDYPTKTDEQDGHHGDWLGWLNLGLISAMYLFVTWRFWVNWKRAGLSGGATVGGGGV
jgi:hypothetical protein